LIIERALALPGDTIGVDRLKIIVLTVVWRRQHAVDALILEELLAEDEDDESEVDPSAETIRVYIH
jgi:Smg protein